MKKLTITASRYPVKKEVAVFFAGFEHTLHFYDFWFRVCNFRSLKEDGFTLSSEITEARLCDFQKHSNIKTA